MTSLPSSELRDRIAAAITADAMKPRAERVGLVNAMLAIVQPELDQIRAELEQARQQTAANDRALGVLLHYAAEAHRRKWAYDNGGEGTPSDAFTALHQLGNEIKASVDKLTSLAAQPTT